MDNLSAQSRKPGEHTHGKVLFLCTGNYYRSRFAEALFNALAEQRKLNWRADSCGLATERGIHNVGPISPYAAGRLAELGIQPDSPERFPRQATWADFAAADKVIALDESEHRPLVLERFPGWAKAVEYWSVHDLDRATAQSALHAIEQQVHRLIEQCALGQDALQPAKPAGRALLGPARVCAAVLVMMILLSLAAAGYSAGQDGLTPAAGRQASAIYYVSSSGGNDDNTGLAPGAALRTVGKVNTLNLQPGDSVLFKCGDVWRADPLILTISGTQSSPITYGAYPSNCSNKPILSGAQPIAGWTLFAAHIYVADLSSGANSGIFGHGVNQLFRGKQRLMLGRWPNLDEGDNGYSRIDGNLPPWQITDSELPAKDWSGAVVHVKAMRWYILNRYVSSVSGKTLTLAEKTACWQNNCVGWGYFINHHLGTLDQEGEWYYDEATRRVYLYTNQPPADGEVEGSVVLRDDDRSWGGIVIGEDLGDPVSDVVIENLAVTKWYMHGIATPTNYEGNDGRRWIIRNNTIKDVDSAGISLAVWVYEAQDNFDGWRGGQYVEVRDNLIEVANHFGIDAYSRDSNFIGNTIQAIGLPQNLGQSGLGCGYSGSNCTENGDGIRIKLDRVNRSAYGNSVRSNHLEKIAYNGMDVFGPQNTFEYNLIQAAGYTKGDCGGIRTYGGDNLFDTDAHDIVIRNNIIVDTIGNTDGAHTTYKPLFGMGLYIDHYSRDVEVSGNTITSSTIHGILYQNSTGQIKNNTLYNNAAGDATSAQVTVGPDLSVISDFSGNVMYALKDNARTLSLKVKDNLTTANHNAYFHPYQAKNISVEGDKTFEEWQAYSGKDAGSKKNWFILEAGDPDLSEIFYNATQQAVTVDLGFTRYLDLDQNEITGSLLLQPFESRVLVKNGFLSLPELSLTMRPAGPLTLTPGAPLTFTLEVENHGNASATGVVLTNHLPPELVSATWQTSASLAGTSARSGTRYVWQLPDLAAGATGVITVSAVLSFTPGTTMAALNKASIQANEAEINAGNNSASILLGGFRIYLPFTAVVKTT